MLISKKTLPNSNLIHTIFPTHPNAMIMDIETTGFSAKFAQIYLIGMIYLDGENQSLICEQWFCEKSSDEYELLVNFNKKIKNYPELYHFNGDLFDMPFIKNRMDLYKMTIGSYASHDYLKLVRPFKSLLGLDNIKLKTIEAYLGYDRSDPFSGGDLIEIYEQYVGSNDQTLLKVLLNHNYEDLLGLYDVTSNHAFFSLLRHFKHGTFDAAIDVMDVDQNYCTVTFSVPTNKVVALDHDLFQLSLKDETCTLRIPVLINELKYFFENYKDYDYLLTEDYAIHKSIGKYVDKDHKKSATRETCYIKKEGLFLPSYKNLKLPFNHYYFNYKDVKGYVAIEDLVDLSHMSIYINGLLSLI